MWMTVKEVSEEYRLAESTIYQWANCGKIPSYKVGGVVRFDDSELRKWFSRFKRQTEVVPKALKKPDTTSNYNIDEIVRKAIDDTSGNTI